MHEGNAELESRIFDKFVIPEPNTGCWIWIGAAVKGGYGNLKLGGVFCSAHRAMWEMRNGPMPRDLLACHSCDTPACVNPDHIWPGTNLENLLDSIAKGRRATKPALPRNLNTRTATTEDAEAAMVNPAVEVRRAERLMRRVYKGRDPAWVAARIATLRLERDLASGARIFVLGEVHTKAADLIFGATEPETIEDAMRQRVEARNAILELAERLQAEIEAGAT